MQKSLIIKLSLIACLCCLFVVGLGFLSHLIYERQFYHEQVIEEISQTQVGKQSLATPFILKVTGNVSTPILPSSTDLNGTLDVSQGKYSRGIHKAVSYDGMFHVKQSFAFSHTAQTTPNQPTLNQPNPNQPNPNQPNPNTNTVQNTAQNSAPNPTPAQATPITPSYKLIIPVGDLRGVNLSQITLNGKSYPVSFAKESIAGGIGTHHLVATLPTPTAEKASFELEFSFELSGLSGLTVVPFGENHRTTLTGNWQSPKFWGDMLPAQKTLEKTGFHATWQNPFINNQNNASLTAAFSCKADCGFSEPSFEPTQERFSAYLALGSDFVSENSVYTLTDRTIKYALLLLVISFGTFFLFEMIKNLRIHPVQYGLVAAALLVFYVLLLSLAEHVVFWQAYLVASVACVGLIGWYACYMLGGVLRGGAFAVILGGLYAGFYVVLSVSDFNLLLGAVFCFVLLGAVMFITRHIDWYTLGKGDSTDTGVDTGIKTATPISHTPFNPPIPSDTSEPNN